MGAVQPPRPVTVLVADDEPQLLRLVVRVLEREGYDVVPARDGQEALAAFAERPGAVAALVLDAALVPEGAGGVIERVTAERPEVGVVLMSGDQLGPYLREALRQRGGRFLRKPFLPADLTAAVRAVLSREAA
jgi:DNA-binding response OmpR family regulator